MLLVGPRELRALGATPSLCPFGPDRYGIRTVAHRYRPVQNVSRVDAWKARTKHRSGDPQGSTPGARRFCRASRCPEGRAPKASRREWSPTTYILVVVARRRELPRQPRTVAARAGSASTTRRGCEDDWRPTLGIEELPRRARRRCSSKTPTRLHDGLRCRGGQVAVEKLSRCSAGSGRQAGGQLCRAASATSCRSSRLVPLAAWTAMPLDTVMR